MRDNGDNRAILLSLFLLFHFLQAKSNLIKQSIHLRREYSTDEQLSLFLLKVRKVEQLYHGLVLSDSQFGPYLSVRCLFTMVSFQ